MIRCSNGGGVGGIVKDVLPQRRLTIHIIATNQESRQFTCTAPAELSYLIEGLAA